MRAIPVAVRERILKLYDQGKSTGTSKPLRQRGTGLDRLFRLEPSQVFETCEGFFVLSAIPQERRDVEIILVDRGVRG